MADVVGLYRRFGVRLPEVGDGWASTRCFTGAHQDRHPSARVHLRSGGFRCFGCNMKGGVLDALELLGVRDRQEGRRLAVDYGIMEPSRRPPRPKRPVLLDIRDVPAPEPDPDLGSETGTVDWDHIPAGADIVLDRAWTYTDRHGAPVGRVRRLDLADGSKRIWQERPDGDNWTPGMAGKHLPLYRLPKVLEHAQAGHRILIVEGEKAVDALDRVGFFATTNAGGAGKWRTEHTRALTGATVLVVNDCDLPGRLHAIRVSIELGDAEIKVVGPFDIDPTRNNGFDIVDHLAGVANTVRAVTPELTEAQVRAHLHDHVQRLIGHQLPADGRALQERLEYAMFTADPAGHAFLDCARCRRRRVHHLTHGLAYCHCGAHRAHQAVA